MLQRLEAADLLAELLAQLDIGERDIERGLGGAEKLGGGAELQQFLHFVRNGSSLRALRDDLIGGDSTAVKGSSLDVEPSTFCAVAIHTPLAVRGTRHKAIVLPSFAVTRNASAALANGTKDNEPERLSPSRRGLPARRHSSARAAAQPAPRASIASRR